MGLPKAVQDQIDDANKIQAQQSGTNKTETVKGSEPVKKTEVKVVQNNEQSAVEKQLRSELANLNSRLIDFKKMYDKEVSGSRKSAEEKNEEIQSLKKLVDDLKASATQKPTEQESETLDRIAEEFGDEFISAVSNLSKSQLMQQNASLTARIDAIEKRVSDKEKPESHSDDAGESTAKVSDQQAVINMLGNLVPDWSQINQSARFKQWLNNIESDGRTTQQHLESYLAGGDAVSLSGIFKRYKDAYPDRQGDGDYLPDTTVGSEGSDTASDEIIYRSELDEYYKLKAIGKLSPDVIKNTEAKIDNAMRKGLLR